MAYGLKACSCHPLSLNKRKPRVFCLVVSTDIEKRSQNSYTSLCNGIVSHGAPIGGIQVFADHAETKANIMRPRSSRAVQRFKCVYLHAQIAVHAHLTNHCYFDQGKNPNTPNLSPMPGLRRRMFWDLRSISVVVSKDYYFWLLTDLAWPHPIHKFCWFFHLKNWIFTYKILQK